MRGDLFGHHQTQKGWKNAHGNFKPRVRGEIVQIDFGTCCLECHFGAFLASEVLWLAVRCRTLSPPKCLGVESGLFKGPRRVLWRVLYSHERQKQKLKLEAKVQAYSKLQTDTNSNASSRICCTDKRVAMTTLPSR